MESVLSRFESVSSRFWIGFESVSSLFWVTFESVSSQFRVGFQSVLSQFWVGFESISSRFWVGFESISSWFWVGFKSLMLIRFKSDVFHVKCVCYENSLQSNRETSTSTSSALVKGFVKSASGWNSTGAGCNTPRMWWSRENAQRLISISFPN